MNLGENIKTARKAAGVTQKELAERLQVYQKDISRWENNELTPNAITLAKICRELNASADEILELKSKRKRGLTMTKKKVILLAAAALFAVSGLTALPSGNITGGVGCIVVAAVCAYFGLKKKSAGKENGNRTPAPAAASGGRILDTIRTKVVGVTFNNEDGENRQDILSRMSGSEDITVEKYTYNGEPAAYVKWGDKVIGNLSAELARDLARKYPKARYTAEILEISGGGVQTFGCNIELDVIEDATPSVSQHTGETTVYVDRSNKKYHSKPNCSGMKNPKSIPLSQAKKKYTACKKCCK